MISSVVSINENYNLSDGPAPDDIDALVLCLNDIGIYNGTLRVPFPYTKTDAENYMNLVAKRKAESGKPMSWQIKTKEHQLIGGISLHCQYGYHSHKDEIGYWLARPFWNKGIMTAAITTFADLVAEHHGIIRLEATIFDYNISSQRVVEKCGFNYEGTLKKAYFKDGKYIDGKLYSLVR
jgi:ribosomal-protein-alanine N-acetyltransferase